MSEKEKQDADPKDEAAIETVETVPPTEPMISPAKRNAILVVTLLLLVGTFVWVRSADQKWVHRMLVSNASWDQVEAFHRLIQNPERYQPLEVGMVLDRLDLGALRIKSVEFRQCDFSGSRFDGSQFFNCRFIDCNFAGADFRKSEIQNTVFDGCKFKHAFFDDALLEGMVITNCTFEGARITADQLRQTQGWETAIYSDELKLELGL